MKIIGRSLDIRKIIGRDLIIKLFAIKLFILSLKRSLANKR